MLNSAMNLIRVMMEGGNIYSIVIEGTDTLLVRELCTPDYQGDIRIRFNFSNNREIETKVYNGAEVIGIYTMYDIETCITLLGEFISIVK